MTFCAIGQRDTSPVPRLNLTMAKLGANTHDVDFETYSDKLEAQNIHLRERVKQLQDEFNLASKKVEKLRKQNRDLFDLNERLKEAMGGKNRALD